MLKTHVRLRPFREHDRDEIITWFESKVGVFANGVTHVASPEDVGPSAGQGRDARIVETLKGETVAVVTWSTLSYPDNYSIGIAVAPDNVGSGYGALALEQVIGYLFDQLRAHRIELRTAGFNHHVLGMLRTGMITIEAVLRDYIYVDGRFEVMVIGSMLETEYRELVSSGKILRISQFGAEDFRKSSAALRTILASEKVPKSW